MGSENEWLNEPARKLFIADLNRLLIKPKFDETGIAVWKHHCRSIPVHFVWIQGHLTEVKEETVTLDDGTGRVTVVYDKNVCPGAGPWMIVGAYCMMMAELRQEGNCRVVLHLLKITELSDCPLREHQWVAEVSDLMILYSCS